MTTGIEEVLETLSSRSADIIRRRFGLGGHAPAGLRAIAESLSVSIERVRQIETKALRMLRQPARVEIIEGYADATPMIEQRQREDKRREEKALEYMRNRAQRLVRRCQPETDG